MILASGTITLARVNDGAKGATGAKGDPGVDYSQGKMLQTDPMFATSSNGCSIYNNKSNGTVTVTRTAKSSDNPMTGTDYELVIKNTGEASPGLGGFYQNITSRANAVFIRRIIAKIPIGYSINNAENSMGTGYKCEWLTAKAGTGKFTEYIYKYVCGASGTFSSGGHVYISGTVGTSSSPVIWYLAYSTTFDMTNTSDVSEAAKTANTARSEAADAAKVATNYMGFDSTSGLVVGDMTASSLGKNVRINSTGVDIRNGSTNLASFQATKVILGQNAENSEIDLCDGAGKIKALTSGASTSYPQYDSIMIKSQEIETESQRFTPRTSNTYDSGSTPTYQNDTEIYMLSGKTSASATARLKSECTITSSGDIRKTGISAMADASNNTTRTLIFSEFWDESAGTWANSNQINVYPTKTTMSKPVNVSANISINGITFTGSNKVLWSGGYYMSDTQTATLSAAISAQPNGVVLLWSYYVNGANDNSNFQSIFVPKHFVSVHNGKGLGMFMTNGTMSIVASKYVYISDTKLTGHSNNSSAPAAKNCGITSSPKYFVLRYVIGV